MYKNKSEYWGDGREIVGDTPLYETILDIESPSGYVADIGARNAVKVALLLGQPLLLTGEPGTGKSLLARSIAYELKAGVPDERGRFGPLVFHCKTTSTATDLFYRYDALRRFYDANRAMGDVQATDVYITYEALGLAILMAMEPNAVKQYLPDRLRALGRRRCVILIDEVDKAPRDLPNDILNEIERMTFTVRETGKTFVAEEQYRPILIMTSNSERDLPSAFLRRCVYYNLPFPNSEQLKHILFQRLSADEGAESYLTAAIVLFDEIRKLDLIKKPATAELIDWVRLLQAFEVTEAEIRSLDYSRLHPTLGVLGKHEQDQIKIVDFLQDVSSAS